MRSSSISATNHTTYYRTITIDGINLFYREAGTPGRPVILLLHGFPSSSHMYRHLLSSLGHYYHLVAPDYPGFGLSSRLVPPSFSFTFEQFTVIMLKFIDALGLRRYSLFMQDYGGPVGFRIAARYPERIQSLIIQNANAYEEGLGPDVLEIRPLQQANNLAALLPVVRHLISLEGIKQQYTSGAHNTESISPDAWLMDRFFMEQEDNEPIQLALFRDYHTNFDLYPAWQQYFRTHRPPALITWGKNDPVFIAPGAMAYKKDLPDAELHLLDGSHFALEEHHHEIALLMHDFFRRHSIGS